MIHTLVDDEAFNEVLYPLLNTVPNTKAVIVEIGSFLGGSISRIGHKLKELNKVDFELYAIDNWLCSNISIESRQWVGVFSNFYLEFWKNICDKKLDKQVTPISIDSIEASNDFDNESVDFIFLDGEHTYPYVLNEIKAWLPKIKVGGVICGHDYCSCDGIRIAVEEVFKDKFKLNSTKTAYWVIK